MCCLGVALLFVTVIAVGCGDGGGEKFPTHQVDPATVAANVIAEYDADGDGGVSKSELKKCKGLVMLTAGQDQLLPEYRLDQNGDGSVTVEEFEAKFTECLRVRRQGYDCVVLHRGVPLDGATVTFVPESFMGDLPVASGETDFNGNCTLSTEDGAPGAVPGIYKVEITHPTKKISTKYNTETTISVALDPSNPYATAGVPTFKVK